MVQMTPKESGPIPDGTLLTCVCRVLVAVRVMLMTANCVYDSFQPDDSGKVVA